MSMATPIDDVATPVDLKGRSTLSHNYSPAGVVTDAVRVRTSNGPEIPSVLSVTFQDTLFRILVGLITSWSAS